MCAACLPVLYRIEVFVPFLLTECDCFVVDIPDETNERDGG
jgi:hypothetical protein